EAAKQSALRTDRPPPQLNTHRADYEAARDEVRAKVRRSPKLFAQQLFALAVGFGFDDEVVALWNEASADLDFDHAVSAARAFVRQGDDARAWKAVLERLSVWAPVAPVQIAPIVLLVDARLSHLMTPERCAQVLATPRGPR